MRTTFFGPSGLSIDGVVSYLAVGAGALVGVTVRHVDGWWLFDVLFLSCWVGDVLKIFWRWRTLSKLKYGRGSCQGWKRGNGASRLNSSLLRGLSIKPVINYQHDHYAHSWQGKPVDCQCLISSIRIWKEGCDIVGISINFWRVSLKMNLQRPRQSN